LPPKRKAKPTASVKSGWEIARQVVVIQLGAAIAGIIAALVVRYAGFRILRRHREPSLRSIVASA
jgi:hypothetical protein